MTAVLWRPPCQSHLSSHLEAARFSISAVLDDEVYVLTGGLSPCVGEEDETEERDICLKGAPGDDGGEGGGEGMNFGTGFLWLIERAGSA